VLEVLTFAPAALEAVAEAAAAPAAPAPAKAPGLDDVDALTSILLPGF
jgi:hypothetical protein